MNCWRVALWLSAFALGSLVVHANAATTKEINSALKEKFQITKRTLSGDVRDVGTVLYLNIEGITAERPIVMVKSIPIEAGQIASEGLPSGDGRLPLPIGEPMHVYSIRVAKDKIRLQLGTEKKHPADFLGGSQDVHYQTALEFRLDIGSESKTVNEILSEISTTVPTEDEAKGIPGLVAAIERARETNALAAGEQREVAANTTPAVENQIAGQAKESNGSRQPIQGAQPTSDPENKEKETKTISCEAANWDGIVENLADLFECDSLKAMQVMAEGRQIRFYVSQPKFSNSSFSATMISNPTYRAVFHRRYQEQGGFGAAYWDVQNNRKYYTVTCLFPTNQISNLKEDASIEAKAILESYAGTRVLLNCSL